MAIDFVRAIAAVRQRETRVLRDARAGDVVGPPLQPEEVVWIGGPHEGCRRFVDPRVGRESRAIAVGVIERFRAD